MTNSPDSLARTQSPIMPTWAMSANICGWWRAIHRKRAGAVIATQSPARVVNLLGLSGRDELNGLGGGAGVRVGAGPALLPSRSYSTMPSRMLVALTARTALGPAFAWSSASRTHSPMRDQFWAVSNTCEPGTWGRAKWLYSRWPIPAWLT